MLSILEYINQLLWGFPVLILLSSAHLYFTAKLKFPQKLTLKAIRLSVTPEIEGKGANLSGFAALATTLAATLGTGNIVGVSTAIAIGGPGALFWCWITGILGMATCYAECYLSVLFKKQKPDKTYVGVHVCPGLHCRGLVSFTPSVPCRIWGGPHSVLRNHGGVNTVLPYHRISLAF
ncbi:MAG: alanine:cation symporter family protein [Eisenbergiella massiliensis]